MKTKKTITILWHVLFVFIILMLLYPIFFALINSLKTEKEAYESALTIITPGFSLNNYVDIFSKIPLLNIILNTFTAATIVTLLRLCLSFLASFAFVYYRFKGKQTWMNAILASLFIPFTVIMIPNYLIVSFLGLDDSILGVVLPQVFVASGIFILNQSMRGIPISLLETARLDDVSNLKIMVDIVLPLVRPQVIATGIWFFAGAWNEYIWARMILKSESNYTLPIALEKFISAEGGVVFTSAMAMSVITMIIPLLLYMVFQRYIIDTFTTSGIK